MCTSPNRISLRAGTDLTYNKKRGNGSISTTIRDIAYIRPEGGNYIAISLKTGLTALGESPDEAYSCLIFKLFDSLRVAVDHPNACIGHLVSDELKNESLQGQRMPKDRQMKALLKGIEDFLSTYHEKNSNLYLNKITTQDLDDTTVIDVDIDEMSECNQTLI
jgi:hypothetical protein